MDATGVSQCAEVGGVFLDREAVNEMDVQCERLSAAANMMLELLERVRVRASDQSGAEISRGTVGYIGGSSRRECDRTFGGASTPHWKTEYFESISYAHDPEAPVDALCLKQACNFVEADLECTLRQCAEQWDVPLDILEAVVCDRFIFRRSGIPECPIEWFLREEK